MNTFKTVQRLRSMILLLYVGHFVLAHCVVMETITLTCGAVCLYCENRRFRGMVKATARFVCCNQGCFRNPMKKKKKKKGNLDSEITVMIHLCSRCEKQNDHWLYWVDSETKETIKPLTDNDIRDLDQDDYQRLIKDVMDIYCEELSKCQQWFEKDEPSWKMLEAAKYMPWQQSGKRIRKALFDGRFDVEQKLKKLRKKLNKYQTWAEDCNESLWKKLDRAKELGSEWGDYDRIKEVIQRGKRQRNKNKKVLKVWRVTLSDLHDAVKIAKIGGYKLTKLLDKLEKKKEWTWDDRKLIQDMIDKMENMLEENKRNGNSQKVNCNVYFSAVLAFIAIGGYALL